MHNIINDQRGLAALISVVAVLAIVVTIGLAVSASSVNELALDLELIESGNALHGLDSCVDEATFRLKRNPLYTGGTIAVADASCTVSVAGSGSTRTLTVTGTTANVTHEATVEVTLAGNIAATAETTLIDDWEE